MEAYVHLCRVANALIVLCTFSIRVGQRCNINFKFAWEYPVSRSAMVSFRFAIADTEILM